MKKLKRILSFVMAIALMLNMTTALATDGIASTLGESEVGISSLGTSNVPMMLMGSQLNVTGTVAVTIGETSTGYATFAEAVATINNNVALTTDGNVSQATITLLSDVTIDGGTYNDHASEMPNKPCTIAGTRADGGKYKLGSSTDNIHINANTRLYDIEVTATSLYANNYNESKLLKLFVESFIGKNLYGDAINDTNEDTITVTGNATINNIENINILNLSSANITVRLLGSVQLDLNGENEVNCLNSSADCLLSYWQVGSITGDGELTVKNGNWSPAVEKIIIRIGGTTDFTLSDDQLAKIKFNFNDGKVWALKRVTTTEDTWYVLSEPAVSLTIGNNSLVMYETFKEAAAAINADTTLLATGDVSQATITLHKDITINGGKEYLSVASEMPAKPCTIVGTKAGGGMYSLTTSQTVKLIYCNANTKLKDISIPDAGFVLCNSQNTNTTYTTTIENTSIYGINTGYGFAYPKGNLIIIGNNTISGNQTIGGTDTLTLKSATLNIVTYMSASTLQLEGQNTINTNNLYASTNCINLGKTQGAITGDGTLNIVFDNSYTVLTNKPIITINGANGYLLTDEQLSRINVSSNISIWSLKYTTSGINGVYQLDIATPTRAMLQFNDNSTPVKYKDVQAAINALNVDPRALVNGDVTQATITLLDTVQINSLTEMSSKPCTFATKDDSTKFTIYNNADICLNANTKFKNIVYSGYYHVYTCNQDKSRQFTLTLENSDISDIYGDGDTTTSGDTLVLQGTNLVCEINDVSTVKLSNADVKLYVTPLQNSTAFKQKIINLQTLNLAGTNKLTIDENLKASRFTSCDILEFSNSAQITGDGTVEISNNGKWVPAQDDNFITVLNTTNYTIPYEQLNKISFAFNDGVDWTYKRVTDSSNTFYNIGEAIVSVTANNKTIKYASFADAAAAINADASLAATGDVSQATITLLKDISFDGGLYDNHTSEMPSKPCTIVGTKAGGGKYKLGSSTIDIYINANTSFYDIEITADNTRANNYNNSGSFSITAEKLIAFNINGNGNAINTDNILNIKGSLKANVIQNFSAVNLNEATINLNYSLATATINLIGQNNVTVNNSTSNGILSFCQTGTITGNGELNVINGTYWAPAENDNIINIGGTTSFTLPADQYAKIKYNFVDGKDWVLKRTVNTTLTQVNYSLAEAAVSVTANNKTIKFASLADATAEINSDTSLSSTGDVSQVTITLLKDITIESGVDSGNAGDMPTKPCTIVGTNAGGSKYTLGSSTDKIYINANTRLYDVNVTASSLFAYNSFLVPQFFDLYLEDITASFTSICTSETSSTKLYLQGTIDANNFFGFNEMYFDNANVTASSIYDNNIILVGSNILNAKNYFNGSGIISINSNNTITGEGTLTIKNGSGTNLVDGNSILVITNNTNFKMPADQLAKIKFNFNDGKEWILKRTVNGGSTHYVLAAPIATTTTVTANQIFEYSSTAPTIATTVSHAGGTVESPVFTYTYYADNNGVIGAQLGTAPVNAGRYWAKASYARNYDNAYMPSESAAVKYIITNTTPTVTVTVFKKVLNPIEQLIAFITGNHDDTIVLNAAVDGVNGEKPSGTIKFENNTNTIAQDIQITNGTASYEWVSPPAGTNSIQATYYPSGTVNNYEPWSSKAVEFSIDKVDQKNFKVTNATKTYGDTNFALATTGGNGEGAISFSSSDPTIVSVSGCTATIHKAGTVTITATKALDSNYNQATTQATLTVNPKTLTVSSASSIGKTYDGTKNITANGITLSGIVSSDVVTATAVGEISSANAYSYNVVNLSNITLAGIAAANYTIAATASNVATNVTVDKKALTSAMIADITALTFTGNELKPALTVEDGTPSIIKTSDYTVSYANNTNAGSAQTTITAAINGNYSGSASKSFVINKAVTQISVKSNYSGKVYDGIAMPAPTTEQIDVNVANTIITYTFYTNAECTVKTFADDAINNGKAPVNAGDYWVTASAAESENNNAATSAAKKLTINKKSLAADMIAAISPVVYNGNSHTPEPVVSYNNGTILVNLIKGSDFNYSYSKNTNAGTASIIVTATENRNYSGNANASFTIQKAAGTVVNRYNAPANVKSITNVDKTLADVALNGTGAGVWSWAVPNTVVNTADLTKGYTFEYMANFKPTDAANYNIVESVPVNVKLSQIGINENDAGVEKLSTNGIGSLPKSISFSKYITVLGAPLTAGTDYTVELTTLNSSIASASSNTVTANGVGITKVTANIKVGDKTAATQSYIVSVLGNSSTINPAEDINKMASGSDSILPDINKAEYTQGEIAAINALADAVVEMDKSKQAELNQTALQMLDTLFKKVNSNIVTSVITAVKDDITDGKLDLSGATVSGIALAAGKTSQELENGTFEAQVSITQQKPTISKDGAPLLELAMKFTLTGTTDAKLASPLIINIPLPDKFNTNNLEIKHYSKDGTMLIETITKGSALANGKYVIKDNILTMRISEFSIFTFVTAANGSGSDDNDGYADQTSFWGEVEQQIAKAGSGNTVKVNTKWYDKMPETVMNTLYKNSGVNLVIEWNGGETITIPAGSALKSDATRVYYPLSLLQQLTKTSSVSAQVGDNAQSSSANSSQAAAIKANQSTGVIYEITAPQTAEIIKPVTPSTSGMKDDSSSNHYYIILVFSVALFVVAAMGILFYRKRKA